MTQESEVQGSGFGLPPAPPRPAIGRTLRPALITFVAVALGGIPLGLLWAVCAPHIDLAAALDGSEAAYVAQVGVDVWFGFLAAVAGVVAGGVTWWRAQHGGWPVPVGLVLGGVVGSLLASWLGDLLRAGAVRSRIPSSVDPVLADRILTFHLRATGVYLVYPLAAVAVLSVALWVTGRTPTDPPEPAPGP